jgi:hypothetical protein
MVKVLRVWQYRAVLEPDDGKLSSPVLRGGGGGDAPLFTRQAATGLPRLSATADLSRYAAESWVGW